MIVNKMKNSAAFASFVAATVAMSFPISASAQSSGGQSVVFCRISQDIEKAYYFTDIIDLKMPVPEANKQWSNIMMDLARYLKSKKMEDKSYNCMIFSTNGQIREQTHMWKIEDWKKQEVDRTYTLGYAIKAFPSWRPNLNGVAPPEENRNESLIVRSLGEAPAKAVAPPAPKPVAVAKAKPAPKPAAKKDSGCKIIGKTKFCRGVER